MSPVSGRVEAMAACIFGHFCMHACTSRRLPGAVRTTRAFGIEATTSYIASPRLQLALMASRWTPRRRVWPWLARREDQDMGMEGARRMRCCCCVDLSLIRSRQTTCRGEGEGEGARIDRGRAGPPAGRI